MPPQKHEIYHLYFYTFYILAEKGGASKSRKREGRLTLVERIEQLCSGAEGRGDRTERESVREVRGERT